MFDLKNEHFQKIASLFQDTPHLITKEFEEKVKQSIMVLHHEYLWGACKEAQALIRRKPEEKNHHLFNLIMKLYNKKRDEHQASFLLLQCFENALRSTMAVVVSNALNINNKDDWFMQSPSTDAMQDYLIKKINTIASRNEELKALLKKRKMDMNSFGVFDLFSLGDLQYILKKFYPHFEFIFRDPKAYKEQELPRHKERKDAIKAVSKIREARNQIFHNVPTKIKFQKDLEILLLRLGYNLKKATQIPGLESFIIFILNMKGER